LSSNLRLGLALHRAVLGDQAPALEAARVTVSLSSSMLNGFET